MKISTDSVNIYPEASALRVFATRCSSLLGGTQSAQTPECPASRELSSFAEPSLVETAFSQGVVLTEVAADQMEALTRSLTEPILPIAPWPITRNILESAAIGAWLLDPEIDAQERVSRSFAFRYKGMTEQVKIARASGADTKDLKDGISRLEKKAQALGYPILRERKNKSKKIGVGQHMPTATDLVGTELNGEKAYRILSAVVHGHLWALIQLGFEDRGTASSQIVGASMRTFGKAIPRIGVTFVCLKSADAFCKISENRAKLFGVDSSPLKEAFREFRNSLEREKESEASDEKPHDTENRMCQLGVSEVGWGFGL